MNGRIELITCVGIGSIIGFIFGWISAMPYGFRKGMDAVMRQLKKMQDDGGD